MYVLDYPGFHTNYLLNYHSLVFSTNPESLDIVLGYPAVGGTDFGVFAFACGIFNTNCWESHAQIDVGSPTQSCLIIITLTVPYQ